VADKLIAATGLKKVYGSIEPTFALNGVDVSLDEGEFASLVGQSGSGKSTLLNMLGLLDTPSEGEVIMRGKQTGRLGKHERAGLRNELLGFVFQFHYLLPEFSVLENVLMPASIGGKTTAAQTARAGELLDLLGLKGLENKGANQLSGGQKQRVAIGRALMNDPALVLADEPTGNLDTKNTNQVFDLFRKINKELGTAFLIVTHDRRIAQQTDRILEIEDGRLIHDVRNTYLAAKPD
jgi:lipoprotein-releasing system ATP-binding protein